MPPTVQQRVAIGEELRTAVGLLEVGLAELQRATSADRDFHQLPMLLLSGGLERFMKVVLCFHRLEQEAEFPDWNEGIFKGAKGHDLVSLVATILKSCFSQNYLARPPARADFDYLKNDTVLREILAILSDFGQTARYFWLDVALGKPTGIAAPERRWQALELEILKEDSNWTDDLRRPEKWDAMYGRLATVLVTKLERLARALARLFTLGGLGSEAKTHTGTIGPFLYLDDDDLGKRDYSMSFREWRATRA